MIEGKVVVITGASSGIGQATTRLLATQGAKVVLGARRKERLEKLTEEIRSAGGQAAYRVMDVVQPAGDARSGTAVAPLMHADQGAPPRTGGALHE